MAEYADGRKEAVNVTEPLFVDCQRQRLVPNPAHPDQPGTKVK